MGAFESSPARPQLAFRVGVTGVIAIDLARLPQIDERVRNILSFVANRLKALSDSPRARYAYAAGPPVLRVNSPLAPGSDRLVARAGVSEGFLLDIVFPFPQTDYELTFPGPDEAPDHIAYEKKEFEELVGISSGRTLELDGQRQDSIARQASYQAVGRLVVRRSDLMIAIWDDRAPAKGAGGTRDTVEFALQSRVPVWWIDASGHREPRLLLDPLDLPGVSRATPVSLPEEERLAAYLTQTILPPMLAEEQPVSGAAFFRLLDWSRRATATSLNFFPHVSSDPLAAYFSEIDRPVRNIWRIQPGGVGWMRRAGSWWRDLRDGGSGWAAAREQSKTLGAAAVPAASPPLRRGKMAHAFVYPFLRNSAGRSPRAIEGRLAADYQSRYRTSYFVVFTVGAFALGAAAVGLSLSAGELAQGEATALGEWLSRGEFVALLLILVLVAAAKFGRWRERYISYRILAELDRPAPYLNALGWAMPGARVYAVAEDAKHAWVAWLFLARTRTTAMPTGRFDEPRLTRFRDSVLSELIVEQMEWHRRRLRQCAGAAELFGLIGAGLFSLTLLLVILRLWLEFSHHGRAWLPSLELWCTILPAIAAAAFGVRAYEEFELLADQSKSMLQALVKAQTRLARIDLARATASQRLGAELFALSDSMLSEVAGWAQLFRSKVVEAG